MYLVRSSQQRSATLDEFYARLAQHKEDGEIGPAMLSLIAALRAVPDDRKVWGLTSHYHLGLLDDDTEQATPRVRVIASSPTNYYVEFRVPDEEAPWPDAWTTGEARTESDAVRMILIGMAKSGGWRFPK